MTTLADIAALPVGTIARVVLGYVERTRAGWAVLDAAPWQPGVTRTGDVLAPATPAPLLAPTTPSKIVCVGRNYAAHAAELGHAVPTVPKLFMKPPSSVLGPGGSIELPPSSALVHHEGELALVVGQRLKNADVGMAAGGVFGITAANDVTARDLQRADGAFTRAKGFDTFCPLGPAILPCAADLSTAAGPIDALTVACAVGGQVRQSAPVSDMVNGPASLVAFISTVMTLEPGDVVLTGTPAGVGPLCAGERVTVRVGPLTLVADVV